MKKKILIGLIIPAVALSILMGIAAAALYLPFPIDGKVLSGQSGLTIQVTNLRTMKVMETQTVGGGQFLVDFANSDDNGGTIQKYTAGDNFQIKVKDCATLDCVRYAQYTGQSELYVELPPTYAQYTGQSELYVELPPTATCPEPKVCPVCPTDYTWETLGAGLVVGLAAALVLFMGGGLKIYKNRLGQTVIQHLHTGIVGYHDPNTSHSNPKYRHRRWKDDPMGCINDVKKINENGGL